MSEFRPESAVGSGTITSVEQRVSLITLGVADLARAREFYEALGWSTGATPGDEVVFFQAGGMSWRCGIARSSPKTAG